MSRNYLLVIDSSINENVKLREAFDISEEVKELYSLKRIRKKTCSKSRWYFFNSKCDNMELILFNRIDRRAGLAGD